MGLDYEKTPDSSSSPEIARQLSRLAGVLKRASSDAEQLDKVADEPIELLGDDADSLVRKLGSVKEAEGMRRVVSLIEMEFTELQKDMPEAS